MIARYFAWILGLGLGASALASPPVATMIEILETPPLHLTSEQLSGGNEDLAAIVNEWVSRNGESLWRVSDLEEVGSLRRQAKDAVRMNRLVLQILGFVRDFTGGSDEGRLRGDFRAQFTRALGPRAPGFAWVVTAQRSSFAVDLDAGGLRQGGGAGVQIPLFGTDSLLIRDDQGQGVLRIMPLAGNQEKLTLGKGHDGKSINSPDSGLVIRPSAEFDMAYRQGRARAGFRFLAQPRIDDIRDVRMLAEVYLELSIGIRHTILDGLHIVPRCMMDFSTRYSRLANEEPGPFTGLYGIARRQSTYTVSTEFIWGR